MASTLQGIEFYGGPLDGFIQFVDFPTSDLQEYVQVPINRSLVHMLNGPPASTKEPATSVAVYELTLYRTGAQYEHLGSIQPNTSEAKR